MVMVMNLIITFIKTMLIPSSRPTSTSATAWGARESRCSLVIITTINHHHHNRHQCRYHHHHHHWHHHWHHHYHCHHQRHNHNHHHCHQNHNRHQVWVDNPCDGSILDFRMSSIGWILVVMKNIIINIYIHNMLLSTFASKLCRHQYLNVFHY